MRRPAVASARGAWIALFAPDGVVADPVGPSMFDPDGLGHRGTEAIAAFYDSVIASGRVTFAPALTDRPLGPRHSGVQRTKGANGRADALLARR